MVPLWTYRNGTTRSINTVWKRPKSLSKPSLAYQKRNSGDSSGLRFPNGKLGRGLHDDQARRFALLRRETVHSHDYLKHDHPVPYAVEALKQIQALPSDLAVITMRRQQALTFALQEYDLEQFFPPTVRYCLPDVYVKTHDVIEKTRLMEKALAELPTVSETWMVGDTEADIAAARAHDLPVVAVLSGIRDRDRLSTYDPDFIVDNLKDAVLVIAQQLKLEFNNQE